jgi:hypothetical protein
VHLIERPEKTDPQVNGDPVRPNLLFAQQISMICCFTGGWSASQGRLFGKFPYKKRIYGAKQYVAFEQHW